MAPPYAGYPAHPISKETVFTLQFRRCDPSFPALFPGSGMRQEGIDCLDHDDLSICSQVPSAFFQSGPSSHALLTGESVAILPLLVAQRATTIPEPRRKHTERLYDDREDS